MRRNSMILFAVLAFVFAAATGCASTVHIDSEPQGATVTVDGQHVGETPTSYSDSGIIMSSRSVVVELAGYEPARGTIKRDGDINVGAVVVGLFCFFPAFLWAMDYPSNVNYKLQNTTAEGDSDKSFTFVLAPDEDAVWASAGASCSSVEKDM